MTGQTERNGWFGYKLFERSPVLVLLSLLYTLESGQIMISRLEGWPHLRE